MPEPHETPTALHTTVAPLPKDRLPLAAAVGGIPTWYLSNLKYSSGSLSFDYVTAVSNPYSASAWWVLWPFSMRDYAYYNSDKGYWNWLPTTQSGTITYATTLNSGQLYTVALFKNNNYGLADYIEFQA